MSRNHVARLCELDLNQLKADFARDGFVIIRSFVGQGELDEMSTRTDRVISSMMAEKVFDPDKQAYVNVAKGLEKRDDFFAEFIQHGKHVPIIEALTGEVPQPASVGYFSKADAERELHPHSDSSNGATIWFALDPSDEDNGCVHFLRGSHLEFEQNIKRFTSSIHNDLSDHPDAVPAVLEPGDVSIHDARTIHWSGKNPSGRPRRGVNCFYQRNDLGFWRKWRAANQAAHA